MKCRTHHGLIFCMCLCSFGRGYHEEPFCEIILNLDQEGMGLKDFFSRALWVLVSSEAEPFVHLSLRSQLLPMISHKILTICSNTV